MLAEQTPARYVAFDLLALDDDALLEMPFAERRRALEQACRRRSTSPRDPRARGREPWLQSGEGVVAKDVSAPTARPADRDGEDQARADDRRGRRRLPAGQGGGHGRVADPRALRRRRPAARRRALLGPAGRREARAGREARAVRDRQRGHGDPSRWKSEKELEWIELRPELVVEVTFDHASGGRIRHGTKILRWRDDKAPTDCKLEQMSI